MIGLTLLLILAFAGGILVQMSRPNVGRTWFPGMVPPNPAAVNTTAVDSLKSDSSEETKAEAFLGQVAAHARYLLEQKAALDRQAREEKIAYNLLRSRGCSPDSEECSRLVARQKQTQAELTSLDAALKEAGRLEMLLNRLVDSHAVARSTLDPELRLEIRRFLARCTPDDLPEISDEQWHGGPDSAMRLNAGSTSSGR